MGWGGIRASDWVGGIYGFDLTLDNEQYVENKMQTSTCVLCRSYSTCQGLWKPRGHLIYISSIPVYVAPCSMGKSPQIGIQTAINY